MISREKVWISFTNIQCSIQMIQIGTVFNLFENIVLTSRPKIKFW